MRRRPVVTVRPLYAGHFADGKDRVIPEIRLRGVWIEEIFEIGEQVQIAREIRNGEIVFVLERATPQLVAAQ